MRAKYPHWHNRSERFSDDQTDPWKRRLELTVHREGAGGPIQVGVGDDVRELCPGDTETFGLSPAVAAGGRESRV